MDPKIQMTYVDDEKYEVQNQTGNNVTIDMYESEKKENLSPVELVLAALTSCAAVEIVSMIKKRRRDFKNIKAESTGKRAENAPRYFKSIDIKYYIYSSDLKEDEAERFISLSLTKYCSVGSTIRSDTLIKHSFEILRN